MLYVLLTLMLGAALGILMVPVLKASELPKHWRQRFCIAVSALFIGGLFGIYYTLGLPDMLPLMAERDTKMAELTADITKYSGEVKANPKNLAAWVGLGKSFMESGQYKAAANAFKQTVLLSKGNPLLILAYASAMISDAGGTVTDDAKKSLEMVLMQQPENPEARYLLAVRALQDGHQEQAMESMKALYRSLPDDSPLKAMIDRQIGRK